MEDNFTNLGECASQQLEAIDMSCEEIALDAENDSEESIIEPYVGMEFVTLKQVKDFYNSFAKKIGFGARIRSSKPKRAILVCCNEGQRKLENPGAWN